MNTLFQAEASSLSTSKKVAIAIVALALLGLAVWGGVEMAWRLASGREGKSTSHARRCAIGAVLARKFALWRRVYPRVLIW